MSRLIEMLDRAFSTDAIPSQAELVRFDGYDAPGKEYLLRCFLGKSQAEVMGLLRSGALGNGSACTEELELAEPVGLRYYLHPFLLHFASRALSDPRVLDDETPFFLITHLANILRHRGAGVFTQSQLVALESFVEEMRRTIATQPMADGIWLEDVSERLEDLRDALENA